MTPPRFCVIEKGNFVVEPLVVGVTRCHAPVPSWKAKKIGVSEALQNWNSELLPEPGVVMVRVTGVVALVTPVPEAVTVT